MFITMLKTKHLLNMVLLTESKHFFTYLPYYTSLRVLKLDVCDCIRQENKATGSYCLFSDSTALPAQEEVRSEDDILLPVRVNLQFIQFCSFAYFLFNFQLFAT